MTARRKPVEAWVAVDARGMIGAASTVPGALRLWDGERAVKMVESSPAEARRKRAERAVVRAALKFEAGPGESTGEGMGHLLALRAAVSRLKRGGA